MSTVTTTDGAEIFYKDWGPKNAQPIVFHHGWPLSGDDWDAQMLFFLQKGYRVIAHDRRGHGRSTQTASGHEMDTYAADVAALVSALDLRDAVHVGHSTGGGEAARYVAQHGGKRTAKLVLIGAAIYWCEGGKAKPWRPDDCRIKFINSDPLLVALFLRFLDALGVPPVDRRFRVSIHENADASEAVRWWADQVGVPAAQFQRTSLKKHRPVTSRKNRGADYHGCLTIYVVGASRIYWKYRGDHERNGR